MHTYTDAFVLSQLEYYRRNQGGGPYHSRNLIGGMYMTYQQEARRRGLL